MPFRSCGGFGSNHHALLPPAGCLVRALPDVFACHPFSSGFGSCQTHTRFVAGLNPLIFEFEATVAIVLWTLRARSVFLSEEKTFYAFSGSMSCPDGTAVSGWYNLPGMLGCRYVGVLLSIVYCIFSSFRLESGHRIGRRCPEPESRLP